MPKSNRTSEKGIENITIIGSYLYAIIIIISNGHWLIKKFPESAKRVRNLHVSYTLDPYSRDVNTDFTLNNCLFGSVVLTKNADPDKYKYSS